MYSSRASGINDSLSFPEPQLLCAASVANDDRLGNFCCGNCLAVNAESVCFDVISYAGITRFRFKGMISASAATAEAPQSICFNITPPVKKSRGGSACFYLLFANARIATPIRTAASAMDFFPLFFSWNQILPIVKATIQFDRRTSERMGLVLLRHIPAMIRLVRRTEPRLSLKEDITYKLDE